jgi:hypothetical protein
MRIVVFGRGTGASLASFCGRDCRELVSAAAMNDAGSYASPPQIDPGHRMAIYLATSKNATRAPLVKFILAALGAAKVPVTEKDLGKDERDLTPPELAELVRWIDMLDRI